MRRVGAGALPHRRPGRLHGHQRRVARLVARRRRTAVAATRRASGRQGAGGRRDRCDGRRPAGRDRRGLLRDGHLRQADHRDPAARRDRARRRGRRRLRLGRRGCLPRARAALSHGAVRGRRLVRPRGDGAPSGSEPVPLHAGLRAGGRRTRDLCLQDARLAERRHRGGHFARRVGRGRSVHRRVLCARRQRQAHLDAALRGRALTPAPGPGIGRRRPAGCALRLRPGHPRLRRSAIPMRRAPCCSTCGSTHPTSWPAYAGLWPRLRGVVGHLAGLPGHAPPADAAYRSAFAKAFPGLPPQVAGNFSVLPYYTAVDALVQSLEQTHGEVGTDRAQLRAALASLRLASPEGIVRLDRNRQAIVPATLDQFDGTAAGSASFHPVRRIAAVDETLGGLLAPNVAPSFANPGCRRATPPPWAR